MSIGVARAVPQKRAAANFEDREMLESALMRRLQAIALIFTLLTAPLALVANTSGIRRYQKQLSLTAHDEHCAHIALGICGCHPGHAPTPNLATPLPDGVLLRPILLPPFASRMPGVRHPVAVVHSGFLSTPFHPPRV